MAHISVSSDRPDLTRGSGSSTGPQLKRFRPSSPQEGASSSKKAVASDLQAHPHSQSSLAEMPVLEPAPVHPDLFDGYDGSLSSPSYSQFPFVGGPVLAHPAPGLVVSSGFSASSQFSLAKMPVLEPASHPPGSGMPILAPIPNHMDDWDTSAKGNAASTRPLHTPVDPYLLACSIGFPSSPRPGVTTPPAVLLPVPAEPSSGVSTSEEAASFSREDASAALLSLGQGLFPKN